MRLHPSHLSFWQSSILFRRIFLLVFFSLVVQAAQAQQAGDTLRVLFIGNSYIYTNNLPAMIDGLAASRGGKLIHSSSAPGGYTFADHSTYTPTLDLIKQGNWDYVVLQEQSQRPSFTDEYVAESVFPYARHLDSLVKKHNPCAKTVFYMTWGRKNGDAGNCAVWPPVCTYEGMDDLLQERYTAMAAANKALLCPVAKIWRHLRNSTSIELYSPDESHPAMAGTYAAACGFYALLFKDDPAACTYSGGLPAMDAQTIRAAANAIAYDSLSHWYSYAPQTTASFSESVQDSLVVFTNQSTNADMYFWDFGDGKTATDKNATHIYAQSGTYSVKLIATRCQDTDTLYKQVTVSFVTSGLNFKPKKPNTLLRLYPNPAQDVISIVSENGLLINGYRITDLTGRVLLEGTGIRSSKVMCDVAALPAGFYQVHVLQGSRMETIRFLKAQ